jgi:mycothiol synthase
VRVANAYDMWDFGCPDAEPEHFQDDLSMPGFDIELDSWFVTDTAGVPVAFGIVHGPVPEHSQDTYARVDPEHFGRGLGTFLLGSTEARARERVPPESSKPVVWAYVSSTDATAAALMSGRGYQLVRHFWQMERELREEPAPEPPPGIEVSPYRLGPDDLIWYDVMEGSFEGHWGYHRTPFEGWIKFNDMPTFKPELVSLAFERDQAVGFVFEIETSDAGWVEMLGVLEPWRGRGVGTFLLHHAFADLARRGFTSVRLNVDAANATGATRLYERAGMRVRREHVTYERSLAG